MSEELGPVGVARCFYCNQLEGDLLVETRIDPVTRRLRNTLPRDCGILSMEPCNKCADYMKLGVIVISATDASLGEIEDEKRQWEIDERRRVENARHFGRLKEAHARPFIPNPYRMGFWAVMKDECVQRWPVPEEFKAHAIKARWCFIPHEAAIAWGFLEAAKSAPQG